MKQLSRYIDLNKVHTLIYHMPQGKTVKIGLQDTEKHLDIDFEFGRICDTSDIDGVVHFFPNGTA